MTQHAPYDLNRVKSLTLQNPDMRDTDRMEKGIVYTFLAPNPNYDKTSTYSKRYVDAVTVRTYWTKGGQYGPSCHAKVWCTWRDNVDGREHYGRGHGSAGGYGHHKESAAIYEAFLNAGFKFEAGFGGCGETPTRIAIESAAKRLGWKTGEVRTY